MALWQRGSPEKGDKLGVSIRARLVLICCGIITVLAALGWVAWSGIATQRAATRMELQIAAAGGEMQRLLRALNELVITEGSGSAKQQVTRTLESLDQSLADTYRSLADTPFASELKSGINAPLEATRGHIVKLLTFAEGEITLASDEPIRLFARAVREAEKAEMVLDAVRAKVSTHAAAAGENAAVRLLTGLFGALLLANLLFALFYHSIVSPIRAMSDFARRAAAGDLSGEFSLRRGDEVGVLAEAFRTMLDNLRFTLRRIKEGSDRLSANIGNATREVSAAGEVIGETLHRHEREVERVVAAVDDMRRTTELVGCQCRRLQDASAQASGTLAEMADSTVAVAAHADRHSDAAGTAAAEVARMFAVMSDVSASLKQLTASTEEVAAAIAEMQASAGEVNERARVSSGAARSVSEWASGSGLAAVSGAEEGMARIRASIEQLAEAIERLEQRSRKIDTIVGVIEEIAAQTSLLALNAAILAAQAGQHGSGFAVVAHEVKSLAERTSQSTHEIADVIKAVRADTDASVAMVRAGLGSVHIGGERVREVGRALDEIRTQAERSTEMSAFIERAMAEQNAMALQLSRVVSGIARQVETVSSSAQHLKEGGSTILATMEKIRLHARETTEHSRAQSNGIALVLETSRGVTIEANAIAERMQEVQRTGVAIAATVAGLHEGTSTLEENLARLAGLVDRLEGETVIVLEELGKIST